MAGGLLQLVAYGAQDAYLCGNPQITFFKGLYKRHTNFAMEPYRINFTGQPNWGTKQSAIMVRHADLMYTTYVEVVLAPGRYNADQNRLGYNLIRYAELDIGGQIIDRQYGEFLFLWDQLTSSTKQSEDLLRMVNPSVSISNSVATVPAPTICNPTNSGSSGGPSLPTVLYIPLYFWFTRNPGAALPLIALQYHEVKINLLWNDLKFIAGDFTSRALGVALSPPLDPTNSQAPPPVQAAVYVDYIFLDVEERRRMAQQSHEYLIEQTQYNEDKGISSYNQRIDLTFNHPVKELLWVVQPSNYTQCKLPGAGSRLRPFTYDQSLVYQQRLQFNGQDRLDSRWGDYFNKVQPYQHHTGNFGSQGGAYMYSFALRPEEHQPSGTCNFSRIDTATLVLSISGNATISQDTDATLEVRVYAINYNILRVMSGMGALAYAN
jgi:hypothetical protein